MTSICTCLVGLRRHSQGALWTFPSPNFSAYFFLTESDGETRRTCKPNGLSPRSPAPSPQKGGPRVPTWRYAPSARSSRPEIPDRAGLGISTLTRRDKPAGWRCSMREANPRVPPASTRDRPPRFPEPRTGCTRRSPTRAEASPSKLGRSARRATASRKRNVLILSEKKKANGSHSLPPTKP